MFDPASSCKGPLSSRIALPIALFSAGVFGLVIASIQPIGRKYSSSVAGPEVQSSPILARSEVIESTQTGNLSAASGEDLVQFCSHHVTANRSFVVFKRGTCVVINEPCKNPMKEARAILARCNDANARFVSEATTEGDLIVTFKEPVFHRFTQAEIAELDPTLKEMATALLSPEEMVAAGEGWTPPHAARIGLVARRRLLEDAAQAVPLRIIRAQERAIVSR